jgi:hypothetical protein
MSAPTIQTRKEVNREIAARTARTPGSAGSNGAGTTTNGGSHAVSSQRISEYFGINTLGARQMRDKLPREVYQKLVAAIRLGKKLDLDIAPKIA